MVDHAFFCDTTEKRLRDKPVDSDWASPPPLSDIHIAVTGDIDAVFQDS
jgi:hypothetical protein